MKSILHWLGAAILIAAPVADAQQPEDEQPGLRIRGLSFQLEKPLAEIYAHDPSSNEAGVKVAVKSYLNHEVDIVPVRGTALVFTTKPDPASAKSTADLVAKVSLPANLKAGIFMFLPGSGRPGDPPNRVLVIEDQMKVFPRGSLKILNLSPLPVRIQLEKQNFDFRSGETKIIEDPPVGESNSSAMMAWVIRNKQPERIGAQVWPHPGSRRVLQVLFENPKSGRVEMAGFLDVAVPH